MITIQVGPFLSWDSGAGAENDDMKIILDYDASTVSTVGELKSPQDITKMIDGLIDAGHAVFGHEAMGVVFGSGDGEEQAEGATLN